MDKLGIFHANKTSMCLDLQLITPVKLIKC